MRNAIRLLIVCIACILAGGCQPAAGPAREAAAKKSSPKKAVAKPSADPADPAPGDAKTPKHPGIHVALKAAPDGKLAAIHLNGKSLRNFEALREAVAPLVASAKQASITPKAHIVLDADVRNVDAQRAIGALTNDVLGKDHIRLVDEWELRVEGSPLVLTARSIGKDAIPEDSEKELDLKPIDDRLEIPEQ